MANRQNVEDQAQPVGRTRNLLALLVSLSSIAVVIILGVAVIGWSSDRDKAVQLVLTAVLPLIGSWLGTILAFFFSNESLRTGTQSVTTLTQHLTSQERLQSIPVKDRMIKRADFKAVETRPLDQIPVVQAG